MSVISVCMTHFNRPEKLAATLESLAAQTRPPDEVFLQDDCSPRDPAPVAGAFQHRFKKFVYERNEVNLGMPGNLNKVIRKATGDFVANLHDADEFHPTLLEKWAAALDRFPTAGLVFCGLDARSKSEDSSLQGKVWIQEFQACTPGREFFEQAYVGASSSPIWGTVMVRRSVYERHLPFDARFGMWSDVDMWMRICGTNDIAYVAEPLIILDNSTTPARTFHWGKVVITHAMHFENIRRIANESHQEREWLLRQRRHSTLTYARHLTGRVGRGDGVGLIAGIASLPAFARLVVRGGA